MDAAKLRRRRTSASVRMACTLLSLAAALLPVRARGADASVRVGERAPALIAAAAQVNDFGAPIAVPMTWIIDAKGIVRARLVTGNAATMHSLEQAVLPLLPQGAGTHAP